MKTYFYKPLIAAMVLAAVPLVHAQVSLSVGINVAPPELPIYAQPVIPNDGYLWTPGYWSWNANDNDYYWVPGTWVSAPYVGAMWTPGYWGYVDDHYIWNRGYWGDHIGYYGAINYGFGYTGVGYQGGYWNHGAFSYNRSVNNVSNVHVTNVYNSNVTVVQNTHVSFNGGKGGVQMTASKNEQIVNSMPHQQATAPQAQHEAATHTQPDQRLSVNHGAPKVAATPEPGSFTSAKVESTRVTPARAAPAPAQHKPSAPEVHEPKPAAPQAEHEQKPPQHEQAPKQVSHAAPAHEEEHKDK